MRRYVLASGIFFCLSVFVLACVSTTDGLAAWQTDRAGIITDTQIIPRQILFGNPDKAAARISPDGSKLMFLAPVDNVMNVWVCPADDIDAAVPVTRDTKRGIYQVFWAYTSQHIVYLQDTDGDENDRVYVVDLETGSIRDLTPFEGVKAQIDSVSERIPDTIIVGLNDRDPQFHDLHTINILTGERSLYLENKDGFAGFALDDDYNVRFAFRMTLAGGAEVLVPTEEDTWETFISIEMEDSMTTSPVGFDKTGEKAYLIDSRGRNTAALTLLDLETGEQTLLAEHPLADISGAMVHPIEKTVQAAQFNYLRNEWLVLDPAIQPDLDYLATVTDGEVSVTSRSMDDARWTVAYVRDDGPVEYYLYDREEKSVQFLFTNRDALKELPLVKMHPVVIPARDGLELVSYLSLPRESDPMQEGRPTHPIPLVLDVHGGPWARDEWGYNPTHQWLANRGYAVLNVNFRGSTGFGKDFINAGNLEWGAKMQDDLTDAVYWAVEQGIADPDAVAIMGGSYGGYAVLAGLTFTPELYACGVDIVGPSSLITLLQSIPPYWFPAINLFRSRMGDPSTEEGRAMLEERSPLNHIEKIVRPLLIAQGANDPRVKQSESDQIVQAMQAENIPVTYVLYPDEGHGFARPENRMSFFAVTEAFLAAFLGGRYEPIGDDFAGSTIQAPVGAEHIPGFQDALQNVLTGTDEKELEEETMAATEH